MIRVLVAEDSPTARDLLVWILQSDPDIQVVGAARDGLEAVRLAARLHPDVIVMDIHMPHMDGLQATRQIMRETPTPIVVVSASVAPLDLAVSFSALQAGALTMMEKPTGPAAPNYEAVRAHMVTTTKLMAAVKVVRRWAEKAVRAVPLSVPRAAGSARPAVVAIAASTGGPAALHQVLGALPSDFPLPILIVQHISPGFGAGLAHWLAGCTSLAVATARQGEPLVPGRVLLAPDDRHLLIRPGGRVLLSPKTTANGLCPSANPLFESVAAAFGPQALGVIMTGMGRDGVDGLVRLKAQGGQVLAQDEASCVVFGMPKEAIAAGVVDQVVSLRQLAAAIVEML